MHELESVEESLVKPASVHLADGFIKPKGKPKGGNKNKKNKAVVPVASQQIQMQYSEWQKANIAVHCYILASVAGHLQEQISKLESEAEMIQILDGMFAKSSNASRQAAIRALMNTRMTGGSVRDHCLAMMSHINQAEVMGQHWKRK